MYKSIIGIVAMSALLTVFAACGETKTETIVVEKRSDQRSPG